MKQLLAPLIVLSCATGCARYEYDLVSPPDLRAHIATKTDTVTNVDPLVYRWRTVDNRLVVRIFNPTDDPIELLGDKSTAVAPDGQSHPIRGQTIAPQSHAKLILPPPRPRVYNSGPTFGVGVGMRVDARDRGFPNDPWMDDQPRYLMVYDDDNALYWDWNGQTEVRLTLVYRRANQELRHAFTIRRKEM
jgi:hypothetical protein